MERRCPDCNRRLLEDDAACWYCGRQMADAQRPSPEDPVAAGKQDSGAGESQGPVQTAARTDGSTESAPRDQATGRVSALTFYAGMTGTVILAALLVTLFLGGRPLVQTGGPPLQEGWTVVTDQARTFTLALPEQWQTLDAAVASQREQLQQLTEEIPSLGRATEPLTAFVDDEEMLFLAMGARESTFLIVSESQRLNRLSAQDAIDLARGADAAVLEASHVENFDKSHVALRVALPGDDERGPLCRQQFIGGVDEALLVALCSEPGQLDEETATTILNSVQRLAP